MSESSKPGVLARLFKSTSKIEPREFSTVIAAFFLLFFIMGSYFAARPVRETIGTLLGRETVAGLWLYTALFSVIIIPVYGALVAKVRRSVLLPWIYGFVAIAFAVMAFYLRADEKNLTVGAIFYVWISVLNLMLISVFWSFLLEVLTTEQTKRLFGFIAAGGTAGALAGPLVTRLVVGSVGNSGIMLVGAGGFVCAIVCQRILISQWRRQEAAGVNAAAAAGGAKSEKGLGGNPFAGISIVLKSPYLLGIALFVVLLSAANTFLYFEQIRIVQETFPDTTRRTEVFANMDFVVQSLTVITQLFLTGYLASRLGVKALLTIVPIVMVAGFVLLAFANSFAILAVVYTVRRWGEYAFIRPGREMLFSPLSTETKYKAKSFIDVPVYRGADYVGAQAQTAIDTLHAGPMVAAFVAAVLAAAWAVNGYLLGRKHDAAAK